MTTRRAPHRQSGFTLVELMVSIVVALLLLVGILQILLTNKASFGSQQSLADLQQQSRFVNFFTENIIAHAGFQVERGVPRRFVFNADAPFVENGVVASSTSNGNPAITVRFQSEGLFDDCEGSPIGTAGNPQMARFTIDVDGDGELSCNGDPLSAPGAIEGLAIRYGLDTGDDDAVDAYVDTLDNTTQTQVRSVRLQILIGSDDDVLPQRVARSFVLADGSTVNVDDRRAYQLIDQTVALRNLLP